jgi:hypothetical protein
MLEPRRSQYLDAMGVDVYVPRAILPGARVSEACAWDASAIIAATAEPRAEAAAAVAVLSDAAPARQQTAAAREPRRAPATEPARAAAPAAAANAIPRFALSIVGSDNGVLIVDDAPPASVARADYLRLLGNVLLALQGKTTALALDVFAWPMVRNAQIDQSAVAAREALAAYLQKQFANRGVHTVLLLGANAGQWAIPASADAPVYATSISVWSCLREPQLKRQLWHDLRHLAGARP